MTFWQLRMVAAHSVGAPEWAPPPPPINCYERQPFIVARMRHWTTLLSRGGFMVGIRLLNLAWDPPPQVNTGWRNC